MAVQISNGNLSPNVSGDGNVVNINAGKNVISNEVKTIQVFIGLLTKLARGSIPTQKNVDPTLKFHNRFQKFEEILQSTYLDLAVKYGQSYQLTIDESGPGRTSIDEIACFLRQISVGILEKNNGNPILALDELCSYFEIKFNNDEETEKFEYDHGALRYFTYKELVECNVFPNPNDFK